MRFGNDDGLDVADAVDLDAHHVAKISVCVGFIAAPMPEAVPVARMSPGLRSLQAPASEFTKKIGSTVGPQR